MQSEDIRTYNRKLHAVLTWVPDETAKAQVRYRNMLSLIDEQFGHTKFFADAINIGRGISMQRAIYLWCPCQYGYFCQKLVVKRKNLVMTIEEINLHISNHAMDRLIERMNCTNAQALAELRLVPRHIQRYLPHAVADMHGVDLGHALVYMRTPHGVAIGRLPGDLQKTLVITTWIPTAHLSFPKINLTRSSVVVQPDNPSDLRKETCQLV